MKTFLSSAFLAVCIAGCASDPDEIDTAYISPLQYDKHSCEQLDTEIKGITKRMVELYDKLKKTEKDDNWQMGVGLVVLWPVLFFLEGGDGPEASEFARLKGQYDVLVSTAVKRDCGLHPVLPAKLTNVNKSVHSSE